jgi:hypothetical protein
MRFGMRLRIVGLVAVLAAVLAASTAVATARVSQRSPHTTAPDLYINVKVTMTNDKFIVSRHSGPRGADAKFELRNTSNEPHNFSLGNEKYGSGGQTGFSVTLKPGQHKILILFLDIRGTVKYHAGLSADKNKRGMEGSFHIGPCTAYEQNTGVGEC